MSGQLTKTDQEVLRESVDRHPRVTAITPQQSRPKPAEVPGEPLGPLYKLTDDGVPTIGGLPYLP